MNSKLEIRANIKFCFKTGKTATETFELIKKAHGEEAMSRPNVFKWFALFRDGREDLADNFRSGRPKTTRTAANIKKVADLLKNDRCLSVKMIEEITGIPKTIVHEILTEDLHKRKICSRFVPHKLTDDQQVARVKHCIDMKQSADLDPNVLRNLVTVDETWCFQYEPLTKRQSSEWIGDGEERPKKLRMQKSHVKTLLTVFFDSKGIIHKEFAPEGQTVTGEYYLEVLDRFYTRMRRVRPEYREQGCWRFLHDNAPAHKCRIVQEFLAKKGVVVLDHPPYSPDLAPADFWLFPKLKLAMKGHRYSSIRDIQTSVTEVLEGIPKNTFPGCFESFYKRFESCIRSRGEYFE